MRTALIELILTTWPVFRLHHAGQEAAGHPHQADQVGLDDGGPVVGRADIEARPAADVMSGVVDEDVDRLESIRNQVGQAVDGLVVRNIELERKRVVAHFSGELAKRFQIPVDQHDPASAIEQRSGNRAAHAAGRSGQYDVSARCISH